MTPSLQLQPVPLTFKVLSADNVNQLKELNQRSFPLQYQDSVYSDCLACGDVSQLAYQDDELVGGIACRLEVPRGSQAEDTQEAPVEAHLYIMTLAVKEPNRRQGIGRRLLGQAIVACADDPTITEAYLHVQTSNEEAIQFYHAAGFKSGDVLRNYYKRVVGPPDALRMYKDLGHGEL
ncbi:hypothetical protein WJX72_003932 [[Myrmecia] bisecta]|uniref:N-acetyltransferase domain-containing protein n=1 Tax=[Myrmecia] bisecta TaxID=41462 RepID=A0AAW1Q6Y6_9CHLO